MSSVQVTGRNVALHRLARVPAVVGRMIHSPLIRYVVARLLWAIPLLFGIIFVTFVLLEMAPGDPVQALVGDFPASPEYVEQLRREFNLDDPAPQRFVAYIGNLAQGNLGYSFANRQPVSTLILDRLVNTLILTVPALILAALAGVGAGVLAAKTKLRWKDTAITTMALTLFSVPVFWLGQILIIVFAVKLSWLPSQGMRDPRAQNSGVADVVDVAKHMVLPVLALSARELGLNARMTRASMRQTLSKDYVLTARAKGVPDGTIVLRHGLRNALLPVVTVVGYGFGYAIAGSVLVETVFGWPGMGRLLYESISRRDNAVIIGVLIATAITVVIANLITDLVYGILDPRIRAK
jgi:peptide/nickel transport system permease protein